MIEIAGYYAGLVAGLRALGIATTHVALPQWPGFYKCPSANGSWFMALFSCGEQLCYRAQGRTWSRCLTAPFRWLLRLSLFVWAVARHDVFVFGFGTSFYDLRELWILRALGKKLIFVFNGSDTRPAYLSGLFISDPVVPLADLATATTESKRRVMCIERYADFCIAHPLSGHFHEKPFVNYLKLGSPSFTGAPTRVRNQDAIGPVRILHAPSRPELKGSVLFSQMIERLRARGLAIDYNELRGVPHEEVLAALADCDFVLDELYSDVSLAGLGTEAASFRKPALVGGYGQSALRQACHGVPLPMDTYCRPDEVEAMLERLVSDAGWRRACGEKVGEFVAKHWEARRLAERFLVLISGSVPADWFFDPQDITYFHGWGVSEERLRHALAEFIGHFGVAALQLTDKPALETSLVRFASASSPPMTSHVTDHHP